MRKNEKRKIKMIENGALKCSLRINLNRRTKIIVKNRWCPKMNNSIEHTKM